MCGIVGFCSVGEAPAAAPIAQLPVLRAMMDAIRHRGPDGDGTYVDDRCCLGHLRLKIIDLSDNARQPMASSDGATVLTFNGEIYDHKRLRAELEPEFAFRSRSDTEALLYGYKKYGLSVFERINGMFALGLWDVNERRLVLARDRLGKKPLFYYWDGSTVVFASELKAVLRHPSVKAEIDEESLASFFAFAYVPGPRTIFKHIYKVPPASTVTFQNGSRTVARYWELPVDERPIDEDRALDELDALLHDAVRIRLESDVPLGFFLSGGVDSSLVTAIAKRIVPDVRTFTIGFTDPSYDEARFSGDIAKYLGTQHTELILDPTHFGEFFPRAAQYFDEPFADSSLIATYYLAEITKRHVTVALSGDGGDELFCGYPKYVNLRQALPLMAAPARMRAVAGRLLSRAPSDRLHKMGHALQSSSIDELVRWLVSVWKPDELATLMPGCAAPWYDTPVAQTWSTFERRDHISRLMAADIKSYLCDDILQKVDRASMAVALEIRCPLLDYRVVELALRLPLRLKLRGGTRKYLLRKLLARYVPVELWAKRPKHGFTVPVKQWYRAERRQPMREAIKELEQRFTGVLSGATMKHFFDEHLAGNHDFSQKLFALDSFHNWVRTYQ